MASNSDVATLLDQLYSTSILRKCEATPPNDSQTTTHDFSRALQQLHHLEQEYVANQAKQNVLDKLAHLNAPEDLHELLKSKEHDMPTIRAVHTQRNERLQQATDERKQLIAKISTLAQAIDAEKMRLLEMEASRSLHEQTMEDLSTKWKELQKKNAQRKAALQVTNKSHSMAMNDEHDCKRVLEQQTASIQALHDQQKQLEEKKMDLSTVTNQLTEKIQALSKENDLRSQDADAKRREEESFTLEHMQRWYDHMRRVLASVSCVELLQVTNDFVELQVLQQHVVRCFFDPAASMQLRLIEFQPGALVANALAQQAVHQNDVAAFLCEYKHRILTDSVAP